MLLVVLCTTAAAAADSTLVKLIADGDACSEQLFDNQKALGKFLEAQNIAPKDYDVLWRLSRTYADIGAHMPHATDAEKQQQLAVYEKALGFANQAITINPDGALGYVRRAIVTGRIALFKGIWDAIDLVKQTRADCEKAIVLDPKEAAAYYVLGRTNAKVCEKPKMIRWPLGLGWANLDSAVQNYEKAIALRPDFIMYRLDCARTYAERDEYKKAREHLTAIAGIQKHNEDDDQFRQEAKELLEKIKDK